MKRRVAPVCCALVFLLAAVLLSGATSSPPQVEAREVKSFSSYEELANYIHKNMALARQMGELFVVTGRARAVPGLVTGAPGATKGVEESQAARNETPAGDFSGTNVQVAGVDEADVVKSDGRYLYVLSGNKVTIVKAYPVGEAKKVSTIQCEGQPLEAFINRNKLIIFGRQASYDGIFVRVYNVENREKPVLQKNITCRGNYVTSRMIEDYVYVILNMPVFSDLNPAPEKVELPAVTIDDRVQVTPPAKVYYFPHPDHAYRYTTILIINTQDRESKVTSKTFLTGVSQNIYASPRHIYLSGPKTPDYMVYTSKLLDEMVTLVPPGIGKKLKDIKHSNKDAGQKLQEMDLLLDDYLDELSEHEARVMETKLLELRQKWQQELARERDKTIIHKLAVDKDRVDYHCSGEVPGHVLNQFSMDEYRGMFRIATTTTNNAIFSGQTVTKNNIYVLDENLHIIGRLQGLAPTESIYAARFMGDRAYLVTFRRVDPLFVVDLKDPRQPGLLGELKIPGYSTYLHPYDENHLIGIGKEVREPATLNETRAGTAIFPPPIPPEEGLKIALFDVSNPAKPKETARYVISGSEAGSPALYDHKAVLFSRSRNLLVIPVSFSPRFWIMNLPEIRAPVDHAWYGVYVFTLSPEEGIKLKGKIAHSDNAPAVGEITPVKRALYIEDVLYSVSEHLIKMNDLNSLKEINRLRIDK